MFLKEKTYSKNANEKNIEQRKFSDNWEVGVVT
jgi:hypothetical protein